MEIKQIFLIENSRREIELIQSSGLFNQFQYAAMSGYTANLEDSIIHYLNIGEEKGIVPSDVFDPKFYKLCNPDVKVANVNCLLHFIESGRREGRYQNIDATLNDAYLIESAGDFEENFFQHSDEFILAHATPIQRYLCLWRVGAKVNKVFDDLFYYYFYPDVAASGVQPYVHFMKQGFKDGRVKNRRELEDLVYLIKPTFDVSYYLSQDKNISLINSKYSNIDQLIEHYLSIGYFEGLRPNKKFDPEYYVSRYTDLEGSGYNPIEHYIRHGEAEGRSGAFQHQNYVNNGFQPFYKSRPTILVASHEASRTGAPLVGLNLVGLLKDKYNVISYVGRSGELSSFFINESSVHVVGPISSTYSLLKYLKDTYNLSMIILNSIETDNLASAASAINIPTIALVHEFAEYTLPAGRIMDLIRRVDEVIVPAKIIEKSIRAEIYSIYGDVNARISVLHQGKLPWIPSKRSDTDMTCDTILNFIKDRCENRSKIVLGAGAVGIRKGLDLFVQTAYYLNKIRSDVAFVWVGTGYCPKSDTTYSVWVEQMITRMGLNNVVQFIPEQSNLSSALEACDIFYLSSRLDPFPNVVIDALEADKPIICFEDSTGCAELISSGGIEGRSVPYCDAFAAADAIDNILCDGYRKDKNRDSISSLFDFEAYVTKIEEKLFDAQSVKNELFEEQKFISEANCFDPIFYSGKLLPKVLHRRELIDYVVSSSKGLARRNPRPGFSDNEYRNKNGAEDHGSSLATSLKKLDNINELPSTHKMIEIKKLPLEASPLMRCAVHIHLHYIETAEDFARRFVSKARSIDFLITVTSETAYFKAKEIFSDLNFKNVKIIVVPNKGRDLGPFLINFASTFEINSYDLIGHFHGKKSLVLGGNEGDKWRNYLLDTLLGQSDLTMDSIFSEFHKNKKLGFLFAEDPNSIGWTKNYSIAEKFSSRLNPKPDLPKRPVFPIGTMFWSRPEALIPLFQSNITMDELPEEPAPYDGTILHAIERILPSICESLSYEWATVFRADALR